MVARTKTGPLLEFHIIIAAPGIGPPLPIAIAEGIALWTGHPAYLCVEATG